MTKEEVITELKALSFVEFLPNDLSKPNSIPFKCSYIAWKPDSEEVWFYYDNGIRFKYDNNAFYLYDRLALHWVRLAHYDISTIIVLYGNG